MTTTLRKISLDLSKTFRPKSQKVNKRRKFLKKCFYSQCQQPCQKFLCKKVCKLYAWSHTKKEFDQFQKQIVKKFHRRRKMQFRNHCSHFGGENANTYSGKVENGERRNFSQKNSFSSKISCRHLECSIDRPTETISIGVWKIYAQSQNMKKTKFFRKIVLPAKVPSDPEIGSFDFTAEVFSTNFSIFFPRVEK